MAWRHGPTPDPGRRSTVRRGATCARTSRGTPGAAPVWHAQADSAACRPVSTEAPDARASLALEPRASRATAGGGGSAHLTRRLLVELNNAEVGVSSSAASTGASFRGGAGGPTNAIARLRLSERGSGGRREHLRRPNGPCVGRGWASRGRPPLPSFVRCERVVARRAGYRNALAERHSDGRASRPPSFVMKLQAAAWRAASTAPFRLRAGALTRSASALPVATSRSGDDSAGTLLSHLRGVWAIASPMTRTNLIARPLRSRWLWPDCAADSVLGRRGRPDRRFA